MVRWLLEKGVDPNVVPLNESGRPTDSPLIYLFKLKGVEGDEFINLKKVFDVLVNHPDIDVNLEVGRDKPLKKALSRLKRDPNYQPMVDKLISMGAEE